MAMSPPVLALHSHPEQTCQRRVRWTSSPRSVHNRPIPALRLRGNPVDYFLAISCHHPQVATQFLIERTAARVHA